MNIQAVNVSPTLGRRQVPRNSVSFGNNVQVDANQVKKIENGAKNFASNIWKNIKNGANFVVSKVASLAKTTEKLAKRSFKKAKKTVGDFIENNKGAKGFKIAATGLTVIVAGSFAIKEVYDIVTKSNPER